MAKKIHSLTVYYPNGNNQLFKTDPETGTEVLAAGQGAGGMPLAVITSKQEDGTFRETLFCGLPMSYEREPEMESLMTRSGLSVGVPANGDANEILRKLQDAARKK